ncbi:hypothetical protein BST91_07425 [Nonlabens tegetincola]|uniref:RHS repeat domain-containing protein n=1 Tax=Nonlabens tegetincola TaxID=323273 RepID=UPI000A20BCB2|nr:RHS repeat-associated core domain-containing protein [Nonlabens tegetincola]ARN71478.1 hypothetical protein BST91_07425 [Nonlabens tegetincola]
MLLPNRHGSVDSDRYRYSFQGQERDDEVKGEGNSYDFGARMYDPRLMRWFAPDPLEAKYPMLSPYVFAANNPILFKDFDGKDYIVVIDHKNQTITIKQVFYYANEEDKIADQGAVNQWVAFNDKFEYQTKDGKTYDLRVQVETVVLGSKNDTCTNEEVMDVVRKNKNTGANGVFFSDDDTIKEIYKSKGKEFDPLLGGVTVAGNEIHNRKSVGNDNTGADEIGHSLGLDHGHGGVMGRPSVSQDDLDEIKKKGDIEAIKKIFEDQRPVTEGMIKKLFKKEIKRMKIQINEMQTKNHLIMESHLFFIRNQGMIKMEKN